MLVVHRFRRPVTGLRVLMFLKPGETTREPRIGAGHTRLLQRERSQTRCVAVRAFRGWSGVALFPSSERLQAPAAVGFLFTPDFVENRLPLGIGQQIAQTAC